MKVNYLVLNFNNFAKFIVVSLMFFGITSSAFASRIYVEVEDTKISKDQSFKANIYIDTEGKSVNAFDGSIKFSSNSLLFQTVYFGNSVISAWLEKPYLKEEGAISFSGITPGGYSGSKGLLASVIFKTKGGEKVSIIPKVAVLLNDGKGTADVARNTEFSFVVLNKTATTSSFVLEDTTPPEKFTPLVARDVEMFNGQWFLVFETQDKQSSIEHFDVKESFFPLIFGEWKSSASPYVLENQNLEKFISVRAVDEFGNERVITISPTNAFSLYIKFALWFILIVFFVSFLYRYTKAI